MVKKIIQYSETVITVLCPDNADVYNQLFLFPAVGIYSIWFYDKKDCQRIAQLMVK